MQKLKKLEYLPIRTFLAVKKFVNKFFKCHTYHLEMTFIAVVLLIVILVTSGGFIEWTGGIAVFLSFGYISITHRLHEEQEVANHKLDYYYMLKEIFWLLYFVILGATSGIVGIFLFLLYRPWRKYYRKYSGLVKNI